MSIEVIVFLHESQMAEPSVWASAIQSNGFDMDIDTNFDPQTFSGYLPCRYQGESAGFDYDWQRVDEMTIDDQKCSRIGSRNTAISFVTHSDFRELMTSVIASATLCTISSGILFDTESGTYIESADALEWAKATEREISQEF